MGRKVRYAAGSTSEYILIYKYFLCILCVCKCYISSLRDDISWMTWVHEHLFICRIIESQNGLSWKGPYRLSCSNPPALGRDTFHQTKLLQAPSNLALNAAREGAATASLGNLGQGLTNLRVKNFFLLSNLNLPSLV